jgi:hypothetical protein
MSIDLGDYSSAYYSDYYSYDTDFSGWDAIRCDTGDSYDSYGGCNNSSEWLVLIGAILMIGSAMVSFSTYQNQRKLAGVASSAIVFIGALLAVIGTLTYISDMNKVTGMFSMFGADFDSTGINLTSTGVILSTVFAFLGMICTVLTLFLAKQQFSAVNVADTNLRSDYIGSAPASNPSQIREYYENKAATFNSGGAPAAVQSPAASVPQPAAAPAPLMPAMGPLPSLAPLPPVIDDTAAQGCFARAGELEKAGERDKAIEEYTRAIRLNSKYTAAYFQRGMLLMGMGFKPAAVADFRRVMDIADNPELAAIAKEQMAKLG